MNRVARLLRARLCGAGLLGLVAACAPARPPLPAPPASVPVAELERWKSPPPLAADRALPGLKLDTTRLRLDNGLGVTLVARPETNTTSVLLWVPEAGDWTQGPVSVMAEALHAGTHVGAEVLINPRLYLQPINVATDPAGTTFRWNVMPDGTHKAVELLGAFVTQPAFEPVDTRIRLHATIDSIQRFSSGLGALGRVARGAFIDALPTPEDDARGLIQLKLADLSAIHACTMLPAGAELVVVGPARAEDLTAWVRSAFSSWRAGPPREGSGCERWRAGRPDPATNIRRLERTQLAIAYVLRREPWVSILLPAPALRSEDYLTYSLLSRALTWRSLTRPGTLRHSGATYSINAHIDDGFRNFSLLELTGQVEPSSARQSIRTLVEDNWTLADTLTAPELETAKRGFRTELLSALAYNARVAERVVWLLRQGKEPRELDRLLDEIASIDEKRGRDVAARWLKDSKPSIIVASLPQKLVSGLDLDVQLRELHFTRDPQARRKLGATTAKP